MSDLLKSVSKTYHGCKVSAWMIVGSSPSLATAFSEYSSACRTIAKLHARLCVAAGGERSGLTKVRLMSVTTHQTHSGSPLSGDSYKRRLSIRDFNMTVNQLHKRLGTLIANGHGRKPVCVAKETFTHNCEDDGVTILPLEGLGVRWINIADGDGGTGVNKDGSERMRQTVILAGSSGVNRKGQLIEAK